MRIAILDDYQSVALRLADWQSLPDDCEVVAFADHVADEDALVARLAPFDVVCRTRERTPLPRRVLERLPRLKLILATGGRNSGSIDLEAARALNITVCQTGSYRPPTIEIVWWLILSLFRAVPQEYNALRSGGWQTRLGRSLSDKTLGIVGLGNFGIPVAQVARVFGMKVIAWSRALTQERAAAAEVTAVAKEELFRSADLVTIHMPLDEGTRGLVGAAELAVMRQSAYLVNTSRAEIVDQAALLTALQAGRIAGLGVDVFDQEPLPRDHPFRYLPNVVATPHVGFVCEESYRVYYRESLENLLAFRAGNPIRVLA